MNGVNHAIFAIAGIVILFEPRMYAKDPRDRLGQLSSKSQIVKKSSAYGRFLRKKLFVTRDDVARYLFLTNGDDGDRSAAVYLARNKKGFVQRSYWVTSTEASTSLIASIPSDGGEKPDVDPKSVVVKRHDAALPASTAHAVHELWLAVLERSRPGDEISMSPTGVFFATNASGTRLVAATTTYLGDKSITSKMMMLGEGLIDYPKLPVTERAQMARVIEEYSRRLLKRVMKLSRSN